MSQYPSSAVVALLTHARQVPAVERERFAARLRDELADSAFLLETCHRVEAYVVSPDEPAPLSRAVCLPPGGIAIVGEPAIRHAISVAVGRDSVVVGEDQILHQLRVSVDAARDGGTLDPALERLFALALQAGRRARSWRLVPQNSLADVALSAIERQIGGLAGHELLVVGAGTMGRLAVRAAVAAGAFVSVANHSSEGARSLAATTGARIEEFDAGARTAEFGGVVVALAGPWLIGAATIDALAGGATVVVDMSVPSAVPDSLIEALGPRFVSVDALALADAGPGSPPNGSRARVDTLIDRTTVAFLDWLNGRDARATAEALVRQADQAREAELAALWRRLPNLVPEERDVIEQMTKHLAARLFRAPLERLGRDADGRDDQTVRNVFGL